MALQAAIAAERETVMPYAHATTARRIMAASQAMDDARAVTDAAIERAEKIEAALRECLNAITAGGPQDYFGRQMYDSLIGAGEVERGRAALGEVRHG